MGEERKMTWLHRIVLKGKETAAWGRLWTHTVLAVQAPALIEPVAGTSTCLHTSEPGQVWELLRCGQPALLNSKALESTVVFYCRLIVSGIELSERRVRRYFYTSSQRWRDCTGSVDSKDLTWFRNDGWMKQSLTFYKNSIFWETEYLT